MNTFARIDENPAMTFQDIKETKRYGRTHRQVYPPQTKFARGIKMIGIFFSKLGKKSSKFLGKWAKFQPLRTQKSVRLYYFSKKQVNNSKYLTAVRGNL